MTQQQYNEAINLIGHLILTAGDALTELLTLYGVSFDIIPTNRQLIDATIEMLKDDPNDFTEALAKLVDRHIDTEVQSMAWLRKVGFDLPDAEDSFLGGLVKGAIGAIGGLLKKKKRRRNNNGGGTNNVSSQALQAKRDLELQIERMREQQRRRDEQRRKEQVERARLEQQAQARKRSQTMFMITGAVVLVSLVGVALFMSRSKAPMYNPVRQ